MPKEQNLDDIFNLRTAFPTYSDKRSFEQAVRENDIAGIKRTLEKWPGMAKEWRSDEGKPIIHATYRRLAPETLQALIDKGADINQPDDKNEWGPPIVHCALLGRADSLEMLIRAGADIHARDKDGRTALMAAIDSKEYSCIDLLVLCSAHTCDQDRHDKSVQARLNNDPKAEQVVTAAEERLKKFLEANPADAPEKPGSKGGIPTMKVIVLKNARGGKDGNDNTAKPAEKPAKDENKPISFWKCFNL
ncbi:MAG: hypothetical protein GC185_00210 [Alphaproteobacteria bacterium]|nr:hypothetical protein [Alphaproteobacteria bacterium]